MLKKVVFFSIWLVLIANFASAQYYYDQSYSVGNVIGGVDDLLVIYEQNSTWFDFFIFLIIFLGLTQAVFGDSHLKKQSKTLSIGISLALSIGLVFWERNTGVNLLTLGPLAFLIINLLIFYTVFALLKKMGTEWWVAGAWAYVIFFIILILFGPQLLDWLPISIDQLFPVLNFLFWVCLLIGLVGLIYSNQPRRTQ